MFSILGIYLSFFWKIIYPNVLHLLRSKFTQRDTCCWTRCKVLPLGLFWVPSRKNTCKYIKIAYIYINVYARCHFSKFCTYAHGIRKIIMIACNNSMICFFLWNIYQGTEKLALLQEQWESCKGDWSKSEFLVQLRESSATRKRGCRAWMTRAQVAAKYQNDWELANQICDDKKDDPHGEGKTWKRNPDAPRSEVAWLI